ncbi:type II secretion system minor pseudopilin GspJ [Escherichia coli]|uniref:type II secretion system minor pseudopilin GspJ n=1 Tax=Escherichia coli TaxID=562 RepID=UPI0025B7A6EB
MKIVRSGFTLAEMLITIAIFALLVLMAQQVANGLSHANVVVIEHDQKLKALQQTMSFMSHDLTQIVPRQMRKENGQWESSFLVGEGVLASESWGMRFVRGGIINPGMQLPRSNLLTVGYRIRCGYLERLSWPLMDMVSNENPTVQKLIKADTFRLFFYDGSVWQTSWQSSEGLPFAMRIILHTPKWGMIERVWLLHGPQIKSTT